MVCLEGSGVPVLYIGRTVPKGYVASFCTVYKNITCLREACGSAGNLGYVYVVCN